MAEYWYRFTEAAYPPSSESPFWVKTDENKIRLHTYRVTKETPRGVWLDNWKWVSRHTAKQWACPTIEAAKVSFKARRKRQVAILRARLDRAELDLSLANADKFDAVDKYTFEFT